MAGRKPIRTVRLNMSDDREYTQDEFATCLDVRPDSKSCGVFVDNIVVRSVTLR